MKKNSIWVTLALLAVAASWGAAFVMMKDAIERQPYMDFLATRMTLAVLVMAAAQPKRVFRADRKTVLYGVLLGLLLGSGYITQTIGLKMTTAAITGFITGMYVVFTPILTMIFAKARTSGRIWIGVVLATVGLGFISIKAGFAGIGTGELWVLACAMFFALHFTGLGSWSPGRDSYALTVFQLATVGAMCWVAALGDGYQAPPDAGVLGAVAFTAVFSTAVAFFVQTWAQSHMDASRVAIVLTSEVVFAALFAVLVGQEVLSPKTIFGGLLMIAAMLVVEWPTKRGIRRPGEPVNDPLAH